jgi:hypothetical protein
MFPFGLVVAVMASVGYPPNVGKMIGGVNVRSQPTVPCCRIGLPVKREE